MLSDSVFGVWSLGIKTMLSWKNDNLFQDSISFYFKPMWLECTQYDPKSDLIQPKERAEMGPIQITKIFVIAIVFNC